ncbi:MAG: FKBP-type peptidyl-prolyl cis-trans isomerase [Daejeonella sp.]
MKKILILLALTACYHYSSGQTKPVKSAKPKPAAVQAKPAAPAKPVNAPVFKSQVDSASYAFGASIANDIKSRGVTSLNYTLVAKAMNDVFASATPALSPAQSQELIYRFLSSIEKQKFQGSIGEGAKFMTENSKKAGIVTLPSGLQYEVLTTGTGIKPKSTDEVTVNYKGTLTNGKQFDSSYDRGEPTTFMLNQVIPGWTEGVQQMPVGSKYRFYIPYSLAYGERGAGQDIPPYSNLIFEIELISAVSK